MGEPVRIVDLARAMIELSGLDPDRDIDDRDRRAPARREAPRGAVQQLRAPPPTAAEKILLAEREPLASDAVESMFAEIGLLVLEGDAAGLAAKVSELAAARREPPAPEPSESTAGGGQRQRPARRASRGACAPRKLPPFMSFLPFALSLSSTFTKIGAIAAFAALVGIALLSLLVFSQARELKRLREWAGRAPERAADLEQRVSAAASLRVQQAPPGQPPRVAPAPAAASAGAAAGATRVAATPVPTAAAAVPAGQAVSAGAVPTPAAAAAANVPGVPLPAPGQPARTAQPTAPVQPRPIAPAAQPPGAPPVSTAPPPDVGAPMPVGTPASAAAAAQSPSVPAVGPASPPAGDPRAPAPATVAAAAGVAAAGAPRSPSPPRPSAPGAAANAIPPVRSPQSPNATPPPATRLPPAPAAPTGAGARGPVPAGQPPRAGAASPLQGGRSVYAAKRSPGRRAALIVGALVLVGVAAALAVTLLGSSSHAKAPTASVRTTGRTGTTATHQARNSHKATAKTPTINPAETSVAVLNATEAEGLAHRTASQLQQGGYAKASALSGKPPGSGQVSVVEYTGGHRAEAEAVAHSVSVTHVLPIEAAVTALSGSANVVVIVGADKASP